MNNKSNFYEPTEAKNQYVSTDNRKTKLTLGLLGKLRRIRDARRYDLLMDQELKSIQYGFNLNPETE